MIAYATIYHDGRRQIWEIETDDYKKMPATRESVAQYKAGCGFFGYILRASSIYPTEEEARKAWRGEYAKPIQGIF